MTLAQRVLVCALLLIGVGSEAGAQGNDPASLLAAAGNARRSVRSGSLHFTMDDSWHGNAPQRVEAWLQFADQKRTVFYERDAFTPNPAATARENEENQRKIEQFGGDIDKAIKAGLGKLVHTRNAWAFDGSKFWRFRSGDHTDVYLKKWGREGEFAFEPRLLGLVQGYAGFQEFSDVFSEKKASSATLVGKEAKNGAVCWHIRLDGLAITHMWISDQSPYRIYECIHEGKGNAQGWRATISSTFKGTTGPLPTKVSVKTEDPKTVLRQHVLTMLELKLNEKPLSTVGSLESLKVPEGRSIIDGETHRRLGTWDGKAIVPTKDKLKRN